MTCESSLWHCSHRDSQDGDAVEKLHMKMSRKNVLYDMTLQNVEDIEKKIIPNKFSWFKENFTWAQIYN